MDTLQLLLDVLKTSGEHGLPLCIGRCLGLSKLQKALLLKACCRVLQLILRRKILRRFLEHFVLLRQLLLGILCPELSTHYELGFLVVVRKAQLSAVALPLMSRQAQLDARITIGLKLLIRFAILGREYILCFRFKIVLSLPSFVGSRALLQI